MVLLEKQSQACILFFLSFAASNSALVKIVTPMLLAACQLVNMLKMRQFLGDTQAHVFFLLKISKFHRK